MLRGASIQQHALTRNCLLNLVRNETMSMRFVGLRDLVCLG